LCENKLPAQIRRFQLNSCDIQIWQIIGIPVPKTTVDESNAAANELGIVGLYEGKSV